VTTTYALDRYHLLGGSGLRVSPVALGAMTFGERDHWRIGEDEARAVFRRYLEAGGNFVDTADIYSAGASEELLGTFLRETGARENLVLATKFGGPSGASNPNAWGSGRKNMLASLDGSLRRLGTDYIDLYWLHIWDTVTPVEETMAAFDALVRSGKVRAVGLSDVPAWYAVKAQTLARERGWEPVAALQLEYSLAERDIEHEHVPAAIDQRMSIIPWAPLASGLLTGKYTRGEDGLAGTGRLAGENHADTREHPDRRWTVVKELVAVAGELGRTPAQVALNWLANRPGVASVLAGATSVAQLDDNLRSLDFELPAEHTARLEQAGRPDLPVLYRLIDRIVHEAPTINR